MQANPDPTERLDLDFPRWMAARQRRQSAHLVGGIPDYAFAWDLTIRRQLESLPGMRRLAQAITAGAVPIFRALQERNAVAVGPNQIPKVHAMGVASANRLGIGIPQIFIHQDPIANAFTIATDDVNPIIVLTSGLVQALNEAELQFVIGHECGHIHNRHGVYNTLWEVLTNHVAMRLVGAALSFLGPLGTLFEYGLRGTSMLVLGRWHRCAEITCDRAGLICSPDVSAADSVNAKLDMGSPSHLEGFDAGEYERQMRTYEKSWLQLMELFDSHPPGPRRAQAIRLYKSTDVFASWRPELRAEAVVPQAEVDSQVKKLFL